MMKSFLTFSFASLMLAVPSIASTQAEIDRKVNALEAIDSITSFNEQNLLTYETAELFKEKFMQNREGKVNISAELQEKYQNAKANIDRMITNKKKCTNPGLADESCLTMRDAAQVSVAAYLRIAPPPLAAREKAVGGAAPPRPSKEVLEAAQAAKGGEPIQIELPETPREQRIARSKALVAQLGNVKKLSPEQKDKLKELMATQRARKAGSR